jgi:hypothetical protein
VQIVGCLCAEKIHWTMLSRQRILRKYERLIYLYVPLLMKGCISRVYLTGRRRRASLGPWCGILLASLHELKFFGRESRVAIAAHELYGMPVRVSSASASAAVRL